MVSVGGRDRPEGQLPVGMIAGRTFLMMTYHTLQSQSEIEVLAQEILSTDLSTTECLGHSFARGQGRGSPNCRAWENLTSSSIPQGPVNIRINRMVLSWMYV
jgi:hypothetical protein